MVSSSPRIALIIEQKGYSLRLCEPYVEGSI